jgi:alcohol dehydrogenase
VCCVQLAKAVGATVIAATSSNEKAARLTALGADHIVDYAKEDFMQAIYDRFGKPARRGAGSEKGVDVVVNYTGGDTWTKSLRILKVGGRLLTCGATAGYDPKEDIRYIWTFELQVLGSNGWARDDITALLDMVNAGKLQAVVDDTFSLERAPEALDRIENRQVFGKLVVTP